MKNAIILILGILIVIALVYILIPHNQALAPSGDQTSTVKSVETTPSTKVSETPKTTKSGALDQCIASIKASANYSQSAEGLILVSFPKGTTYEQAVIIVNSQSLNVSNQTQAQESFSTNSYFEVSVPKGEEAKWICTLRTTSGVKSAILDVLVNLHE